MQDINCELTPLTNNGRGRRRKCASSGKGGRYAYYLDFVRHIWLEISTFFWKLVIFLLLLIIINTILRSIFVKETSLMFTSSVKGQSDALSTDHYTLSQEESAPHLFWIVTDLELSSNSKYLNKLTKQGIVLANYHISEHPTSVSVNRVSALISKYAHRMTLDDVHDTAHSVLPQSLDVHTDDDNDDHQNDDDDDDENENEDITSVIVGDGGSDGDIDAIDDDDSVYTADGMEESSYFDAFESVGYRVETMADFEFESMVSILDEVAADFPPLLMYIEMDGVDSMRSFDAEIGRILKYLKRRESLEIWQNSLLIISSDSNPFSVVCGPRIPNKQRGTRSQALFDVTDWQQTLLHFSSHHQEEQEQDGRDDDVDGFDLWDTIIYGAESPRTELPTQSVSNKEVVTRHVDIA